MEDIGIVALVLVTGYYAWQVRRSVGVTEAARRADHSPRFGMQVVFAGPRWCGIRITNVGPGAAVHALLKVKFIPHPHISDDPVAKTVRLGVVELGRRVEVRSPCTHTSLVDFCTSFQRVEIEGTAEDALGNVHEVKETLDQLQAFSDLPHNGVEYAVPSELALAVQGVATELALLRMEMADPTDPDLMEVNDESGPPPERPVG